MSDAEIIRNPDQKGEIERLERENKELEEV
jgi:hypothetical protein